VFLVLSLRVISREFPDEFPPSIWLAGLIGALIALSVVWHYFIRWRMIAGLESTVRKLLAEGSNRSVLGWCDMELVGYRLTVKRELIESSYDLRAIQKVVGNDEYTFVYFSSIQAFVIPMRLYPEDEYREFVAELREAWDNREAPRPVERGPAD